MGGKREAKTACSPAASGSSCRQCQAGSYSSGYIHPSSPALEGMGGKREAKTARSPGARTEQALESGTGWWTGRTMKVAAMTRVAVVYVAAFLVLGTLVSYKLDTLTDLTTDIAWRRVTPLSSSNSEVPVLVEGATSPPSIAIAGNGSQTASSLTATPDRHVNNSSVHPGSVSSSPIPRLISSLSSSSSSSSFSSSSSSSFSSSSSSSASAVPSLSDLRSEAELENADKSAAVTSEGWLQKGRSAGSNSSLIPRVVSADDREGEGEEEGGPEQQSTAEISSSSLSRSRMRAKIAPFTAQGSQPLLQVPAPSAPASVSSSSSSSSLVGQRVGEGGRPAQGSTVGIPRPSCNARLKLPTFLSKLGPRIRISADLESRLRFYESHHRACAARLREKLKTAKSLKDLLVEVVHVYDDRRNASASDGGADGGGGVITGSAGERRRCQYLIWTTSVAHGMGNKLTSLAGAFVYALLTNRTILLDSRSGFSQMLCEPFGGSGSSSWFLPATVNVNSLMGGAVDVTRVATWHAGELRRWRRRRERLRDPGQPNAVKIHLNKSVWSRTHGEWKFFCESHRKMIGEATWLFFLSNQYAVPGFYMVPSFRRELQSLFPEGHVFAIVGRHLLLPNDALWRRVEAVYQQHLHKSTVRVALQIRTFQTRYDSKFHFNTLKCMIERSVLPLPRGALSSVVGRGRASDSRAAGLRSPLGRRQLGGDHRDQPQRRGLQLGDIMKKAVREVQREEEVKRRKPTSASNLNHRKPVVSSGEVTRSGRENRTTGGGNSNRRVEEHNIAVLIASLSPRYHDVFRKIYAEEWEEVRNTTARGGGGGGGGGGGVRRVAVSWHQESSAVVQDTANVRHNQEALVEMWLLSLCDVMFTSSGSTFGYVAHGLSGINPTLIPSCLPGRSAAVCYADPPGIAHLLKACSAAAESERGEATNKTAIPVLTPSVLDRAFKHCVDRPRGIKLPQR